jgi:starvation-inducible DNA-binding protein
MQDSMQERTISQSGRQFTTTNFTRVMRLMTTTTKEHVTNLYTTRIDIPEATRSKVIQQLNTTLAASLDIWSQTKQAHWNVKGKDFYQLHLLFDDIAGVLYEHIDLIAERITALGGVAHGTARQSAKNSPLSEYPDTEKMSEDDHLNALADRLAAYAKHLREGISKCDELDDQDSNDLYVQISREVDKKLWFVEAHMQRHR